MSTLAIAIKTEPRSEATLVRLVGSDPGPSARGRGGGMLLTQSDNTTDEGSGANRWLSSSSMTRLCRLLSLTLRRRSGHRGPCSSA